MENKEPNRDDAAEQKARDVEYKEKTEQLLELHGQEKVLTRDPTVLLGALGVYLVFVTTLAAVGALAASTNHKTTSEVFLVASALLVLIVPLGVIWYFLRVRTPEKPANKDEGRKSLAYRIVQSSIGRFLANNPVVRLVNSSLCIYWIVDSILNFPLKPRWSLAFIALNTALFSAFITLEIARSFDKAVQAQIKEIWEFNNVVRDGLLMLVKHHDRFVDSQLDTNDKTLAAIVEVNRFVGVVANIANIKQPDQLEGPKAEEHKQTEPPIISNQDTREEK